MYYPRPETDDLEEWKKYAEYLDQECRKNYENYFEEHREHERLKVLYQTQKRKLEQVRNELKTEQKKKYDVYVEEDHLDYLTLESRCRGAESTAERFIQYNHMWIDRFEKTQKYIQDNFGIDINDIDKISGYSEMNIEVRKKRAKEQSKAGRPSKFDDSKIALVKLLRHKGYSMRDIAKELDVSVGTIHRILHLHEQYLNNNY